jgi:hypothetical protein
MQRLEISGAVRHIYIYIYIYVLRRLKVKCPNNMIENIREILSLYLFLKIFNFISSPIFLMQFMIYQIWDTLYFRSQVKSSQCWNWNLPYLKFWEDSRSLKVTPKKIFVLLLILFWKVPPAWRWNCICASRWKYYRKSVLF